MANTYGHSNHPHARQEKPFDNSFTGLGRSGTGEKYYYSNETNQPARVQAPHINVVVFARGMLVHAFTRIYFSEERANESDPVLNSIKNKDRRSTLIAAREERQGNTIYRFDIRLQGKDETVFFDM